MRVTNARSAATKEAMAEAFVSALRQGMPLTRLKVKQITDACKLDRQTFYYHFKNMAELGRYAYEREIEKVFDSVRPQSLPWKTRILKMLAPLNNHSDLRTILLPALGEKPIQQALRLSIEKELNQELLPALTDAGLNEEEAREKTHFFTFMMESVLTDWLSGDINENAECVLERISEIMQDYVAGVRTRKSRCITATAS